MSEFSKKGQSTSNRFFSAKEIVGKFMSEIWQDLQDKQRWKYEQLAPVQLLAKSERYRTPPDNERRLSNGTANGGSVGSKRFLA